MAGSTAGIWAFLRASFGRFSPRFGRVFVRFSAFRGHVLGAVSRPFSWICLGGVRPLFRPDFRVLWTHFGRFSADFSCTFVRFSAVFRPRLAGFPALFAAFVYAAFCRFSRAFSAVFRPIWCRFSAAFVRFTRAFSAVFRPIWCRFRPCLCAFRALCRPCLVRFSSAFSDVFGAVFPRFFGRISADLDTVFARFFGLCTGRFPAVFGRRLSRSFQTGVAFELGRRFSAICARCLCAPRRMVFRVGGRPWQRPPGLVRLQWPRRP